MMLIIGINDPCDRYVSFGGGQPGACFLGNERWLSTMQSHVFICSRRQEIRVEVRKTWGGGYSYVLPR